MCINVLQLSYKIDCPIHVVNQSLLPISLSSFSSPCPSYLLDNFTIAYFLTLHTLNAFHIPLQPSFMQSTFQSTHVAARCQQITCNSIEYLIDGAHTPLSMKAACNWFEAQLHEKKTEKNGEEESELLFYCGRDKNLSALLSQLVGLSVKEITFSQVKHPKPEYTYVGMEYKNNLFVSSCYAKLMVYE